MRPLSIALFTDTFLHDPNGVASSLVLLRRELARRGHAVVVVAPSLPGRPPMEPGVVRVPSVPYPCYRTQRLAWPVGDVLPPGVDIVHAHTPFGVGLAAARVARRRQIPLVATVHVDYASYLHYVPGLAQLDRWLGLLPRLMRLVYGPADLLLSPSVAARRVAESYGTGRPVAVVPNGVDRAFLEAAPPVASPWPEGTRRLLAVGRLGREKEFGVLLEALSRLATTDDPHLVILGGGPERRGLLDRSRELGVADRLTVLPPVPFSAIGGYYREAEVLLSTSPTETQGLVVWEAQAMGVPVVAVAAGGAAEAVVHGETGFLVAPGDARAMALRVREILADEGTRRSLGEHAREWAGRGSIGAMVTDLLGAYGEAAALHGKRCPASVGSHGRPTAP
jgi:glycosyltransferase involved in cell wall biosynthesis